MNHNYRIRREKSGGVLKQDYLPHVVAFVLIFMVGAVFKTISDWRVAVAHEALQADVHRIADAMERAHPQCPKLVIRDGFLVCK